MYLVQREAARSAGRCRSCIVSRMRYALRDVPSNPTMATVDNVTLDKGGEAKELDEDQYERLRATGVKLEEAAAEPKPPAAAEPKPKAGS